ncbi:hypothetical protein SKAU_G00027360 [Synaphobranchus kaupii]|uniref:Uncharacterized protein n=1 Tax=Synaphobranchus kaupii TaxID=118154 RepID=A0A9Q1JDQ7_SYNKA|nr:hypothetical protein SKAU_G00027360 [Synaphobranchus kaupii]
MGKVRNCLCHAAGLCDTSLTGLDWTGQGSDCTRVLATSVSAGRFTKERCRMKRDAGVWRWGAGREDKLVSGMHMEAPMQNVPQRYRSVLGPLSLFTQCKQNEGRVEEQCLITPDLEGQRMAPTSLPELCHLVQCRIQVQSVLCSASHEDQQALVRKTQRC